jgi:hypothetical protein
LIRAAFVLDLYPKVIRRHQFLFSRAHGA